MILKILCTVLGALLLLFSVSVVSYFNEMQCKERTIWDTTIGKELACYTCREAVPFWPFLAAEWHLRDPNESPKYQPFIILPGTCHVPYDEAYRHYKLSLKRPNDERR